MFTRILKPASGLKPLNAGFAAKTIARPAVQMRFNATIAENAVSPLPASTRSTKPCYERATFTIRDGPIYHGKSFGAKTNISGEAVFTTSLVGYPESMTDPSYRGQILVFTQPLIGNYGVPAPVRDEYGLYKYFESPNIQAAAIVVADAATQYSHWTAVESLAQWCAREGVPAITGVDTRDIVTYLREQGSSLGKITVGEEYDADEDEAQSEQVAAPQLLPRPGGQRGRGVARDDRDHGAGDDECDVEGQRGCLVAHAERAEVLLPSLRVAGAQHRGERADHEERREHQREQHRREVDRRQERHIGGEGEGHAREDRAREREHDGADEALLEHVGQADPPEERDHGVRDRERHHVEPVQAGAGHVEPGRRVAEHSRMPVPGAVRRWPSCCPTAGSPWPPPAAA